MKETSLLFLLVFVTACQTAKNYPFSNNEINLSTVDSLSIDIEAINLSEDMSRLSTKNDEILILIYELKDSLELSEFLFSKQLKLDETIRSKKFWLPIDESLTSDKLLFFLIEQDSETPIEQIDPVIRIHHQKIIDAFNSRDYLEIEKYIGDEDILGVKIISQLSKKAEIQFKFSGIYKLDKYEYSVRIGK